MTCTHETILTRRFVDNNDVAMWVCAECKMRFEPASALDKSFREGAKYEREECARLAQETVCDTHIPTGIQIYGTKVAKAIRARNL
jgi:hypothetical protein